MYSRPLKLGKLNQKFTLVLKHLCNKYVALHFEQYGAYAFVFSDPLPPFCTKLEDDLHICRANDTPKDSSFHISRPPYGVGVLIGAVIFIPSISCTIPAALSMALINSLTKELMVFSPLSFFSNASSKNI
ncbi:hypothetical protein BpHYR1_054616 [Brachionus plicatilis]|uniref:Uncharacterized protein n=1 Tax=Brachionus plicatilis TaxID=10195 RepID=A0A3M7QYF6_BRAPC|nr:hypothetical protein BpHYR1_054616 [Brachionus plicatilis]